MRLLRFLIFFLPITVFAQQDTIRISELDQTLFGQSQIQSILLNSEYRPINFFYSNVFKYHLKPFTGVAMQQREDRRILRINLVEGRIIHLEEEYAANYGMIYVYDRLRGDTLARDSAFWLSTENKFVRSSVLFMGYGRLRVEQRDIQGGIYRGYFASCVKGNGCTDDDWSFIETRDGHQIETESGGRREVDFKNGDVDGRWHAFDQNGHLVSVYEANEFGERHGEWEGYFPNGVVKERGRYEGDNKVNQWIYTDSALKLVKEEWYSFRKDEYVWHNLDSTKIYYENGALWSFYSGRNVKDTCFNQSRGEYYETGTSYQQIYMEWYEDGRQKNWRIGGFSQCYDSVFTDTVRKEWYANGNLKMIVQQNDICTKYFADGKIQSHGIPYNGGPRNGDVQIIDSENGILVDRTYNAGKLLAARDSSFFKRSYDTSKAEQLVGAAVIGLYPHLCVSGGGSSWQIEYRVRYPIWKDSSYIPAAVVDSLGRGILSVWNSFPDSTLTARDSLFAFAQRFHPSENEWYYTIEFVCPDTALVFRNARTGRIATGNYNIDSYFQMTGCKAVSVNHKGGKFRYGTFNMVIVSSRPLNFYAFARYTTGANYPIQLWCGTIAWEDVPVIYRVSQACLYDDGWSYPCAYPMAYYTFSVTSNNFHSVFQINSDFTTDFMLVEQGTWYFDHRY